MVKIKNKNMKFRLIIILNKIKEYQERIGVINFGNGDKCFEHHLNKTTNGDLHDIQRERNFLTARGINVADVPDIDFWENVIARLYDIKDKIIGGVISISISLLSSIISICALLCSIFI